MEMASAKTSGLMALLILAMVTGAASSRSLGLGQAIISQVVGKDAFPPRCCSLCLCVGDPPSCECADVFETCPSGCNECRRDTFRNGYICVDFLENSEICNIGGC